LRSRRRTRRRMTIMRRRRRRGDKYWGEFCGELRKNEDRTFGRGCVLKEQRK